MSDRWLARVPLLLMLAVLALTVQVALVQSRRGERLAAALPLAVLTVAYVQAGRRRRRGGDA